MMTKDLIKILCGVGLLFVCSSCIPYFKILKSEFAYKKYHRSNGKHRFPQGREAAIYVNEYETKAIFKTFFMPYTRKLVPVAQGFAGARAGKSLQANQANNDWLRFFVAADIRGVGVKSLDSDTPPFRLRLSVVKALKGNLLALQDPMKITKISALKKASIASSLGLAADYFHFFDLYEVFFPAKGVDGDRIVELTHEIHLAIESDDHCVTFSWSCALLKRDSHVEEFCWI